MKNKVHIKNIKLILSGGGTRGIYQIGAIKAIQEFGLWEHIISISSCSIGVYNAIASLQYDIETAYDMWKKIAEQPVFKNINQYADDYLIQMTKTSVLERGIDISPLMEIIKSYVDEDVVRQTDKELIISTYNMSERRQQYYELKDIPHGQLLDYVMASSRLPIFKKVIINNQKYLDGGIGDNMPYYSKLPNKHFDLVINIKISHIPYFIPWANIKNITYDNELIIKPSNRIGNPLEFKKPSFDVKYNMGYSDTKRLLKAYLKL